MFPSGPDIIPFIVGRRIVGRLCALLVVGFGALACCCGVANGMFREAGGGGGEDAGSEENMAGVGAEGPRKAFFMCVTNMLPKIRKPNSTIGLTLPRRM